MRAICGLFLMLSSIVAATEVFAMWPELTPAQMEEAIAYGREYAGQPFSTFREPWCVFQGENLAEFHTPFLTIARASRKAAMEGKELPLSQARKLNELLKGVLLFGVALVGEGPHFASGHTAFLQYGGRRLEPMAASWTPPKQEPVSGKFVAVLMVRFPADMVDPRATFTIVVMDGANGNELPFVFDLSTIR